MKPFDVKRLKLWFANEQRDLPWRMNPSPYAVWISEIMLQQTQVSVVIPYFERWMEHFPTIQSLAEASLDEVIKEWEGLGYYSRARYLHEGARYVMEKHHGILPSNREDLTKIKGIGDYTIGAILGFAFHQRVPAVDGNVMRVLSRYFMIEQDISRSTTIKDIRSLAAEILPNEESWVVSEALIELGATVCGRTPKCLECPLKGQCASYAHGVTDRIPYKSKKTKTQLLYRAVAVITCGESILIKRVEKGEIMSDLHEFPYLEISEKGLSNHDFQQKLLEKYGLGLQYVMDLPEEVHSFTEYRAKLMPTLFTCQMTSQINPRETIAGLQWLSWEQLDQLAFSSGHRRILFNIRKIIGR